MIKKIWNWIKNIFVPKSQDEHLEMYEVRSDKAEKINRKHQGDHE